MISPTDRAMVMWKIHDGPDWSASARAICDLLHLDDDAAELISEALRHAYRQGEWDESERGDRW